MEKKDKIVSIIVIAISWLIAIGLTLFALIADPYRPAVGIMAVLTFSAVLIPFTKGMIDIYRNKE